jgi:hypothetical protein
VQTGHPKSPVGRGSPSQKSPIVHRCLSPGTRCPSLGTHVASLEHRKTARSLKSQSGHQRRSLSPSAKAWLRHCIDRLDPKEVGQAGCKRLSAAIKRGLQWTAKPSSRRIHENRSRPSKVARRVGNGCRQVRSRKRAYRRRSIGSCAQHRSTVGFSIQHRHSTMSVQS